MLFIIDCIERSYTPKQVARLSPRLENCCQSSTFQNEARSIRGTARPSIVDSDPGTIDDERLEEPKGSAMGKLLRGYPDTRESRDKTRFARLTR
jgi:hypothetical protein